MTVHIYIIIMEWEYRNDIKTDLHQQDLNVTPQSEAYGAQFLAVSIKPS